MKLSEVPIEELRTNPAWVVSNIGEPGQITGIHSRRDGNTFQIYLTIEWASGKVSSPDWPYECDHITINANYTFRYPETYVISQVYRLTTSIEHYQKSQVR